MQSPVVVELESNPPSETTEAPQVPPVAAKQVDAGMSTDPVAMTSSTLIVASQGGTAMPETMRATLDLIRRVIEVSLHTTYAVFSSGT